MTILESDMRQRTETDWQTEFWPAFLLSIVTCGIYMFFILFKLLERREQHFERMVNLRTHLMDVLKEKAAAAGKTVDLEEDMKQLEGLDYDATKRDRQGDKSPVMWLVLSLVASPVVYYVYYFLNDDFRAHESHERQFMLKASEVMNKLRNLSEKQIEPQMVVPERNFVTFLILSIVTCGIYGIYWLYTLINDPNMHFDDHAVWEAQLLEQIQS
ncbi:MAG: DUF4234 domain-containing protein [Thermoleophilia bacterium]